MTAFLDEPRSFAEIEYPNAGRSFPQQAMSESKTALLLFPAGFYGRQDAYWVAQRGLKAHCVDLDGDKLGTMERLYPEGWTFEVADAFEFAAKTRRRFDVVVTDSWSNRFQECADMLPTLCRIARNVVLIATGTGTNVEPPEGWQVVDIRLRSRHLGGVFWTVLERTGEGIDPSDVSACLVTRGDQPKQLARIIDTLPYDEVIVWDNSQREHDLMVAGRYAAMLEAADDVVYFQDDDTLFTDHDKLCAAYEPGGFTAVYGHGNNDGGYGDLPLVCGGGLADRKAVAKSIRAFDRRPLEEWGRDELAYADFAVGVLTPFRHVHLPFEINMQIAQHPSRLVNQPWAAEAKARVTAAARAIRDGK